MASLRDIKGRIKSIDSTKKITSAMNLVATSKLNKSKEAALKTRPFFNKIISTMHSIAGNAKGQGSPFLKPNGCDKTAYITLSGDKGLCGGYNSNICKLTIANIKDKEKSHLIVVGRKGIDQFRHRGYEVAKGITDISEAPTYQDAKDIADEISRMYLAGEVGEVYLSYTKFKSSIQQEPEIIKLLPLDMNDVEKPESSESKEPGDLLIYEPSPEEVLGYIIPQYIGQVIYGALCESAASENGARMSAMDSATENAEEIQAKLSIEYNRARQAAITQELTEIVAGVEALK